MAAPKKAVKAAAPDEIEALKAAQEATDKKLDTVIDLMAAIAEKVEREPVAAVPTGTAAKDAPAIINQHFEAAEQFIGGRGTAEFASIDIPGQQELEQPLEGDVNSQAFAEKMANLQFNEEKLTVDIHTTTDKDADKIFEIAVNGRPFVFQRGKQYTVPRYVVEGLARAKPVGYRSEEYLDAQGLRQMRYPTERGVRYPFSIVNATARDNAWLQHVLAQP